jgi:dTDP-4-dehydrorhamnose 3,5-epimerase
VAFHVLDRPLEGVVVFRSDIHKDERGHLMEAFRADAWCDMGVPDSFVQENQSFSRKGVVRGLHFQWDPMMGKVMRVTRGRAFLVGADIRHGSPTLGQWFGLEASEEDALQVWAPPGFARGFCALEEGTTVLYKCTGTWNAIPPSASAGRSRRRSSRGRTPQRSRSRSGCGGRSRSASASDKVTPLVGR